MLLRWKELSLFSCLAYVVHVSLLYISVLTTQALYTTILVFTVSLGLVHTHEVLWLPSQSSNRSQCPSRGCWDGGAKICELFNDIELIVIDGDGWQFHCILPQDVCLLQTDGYSEILAGLRETVHQSLQLLLGVGRHCCIDLEQHVSDEGFTNLCLGSEAAKIEKPAF